MKNKNKPANEIVVRALRTLQGNGVKVFAFFLYGSDITKVADITRITRDNNDELKGFQRSEIKNHVKSIVQYLDSDNALFPNSILLALGKDVVFRQSRGPTPDSLTNLSQSGNISIPILPEGRRSAWIVDGQQRSLALSKAKNSKIPVPVVAFVSPDIETQREQFILVNKAKPLPTRLINELLPEVDALLPNDLSNRKLPSELCNLLNRDPQSPFYMLIRRESNIKSKQAIVIDSAIMESIKRNLRAPMGALSQYKTPLQSDPEAMYKALVLYWTAVREVFPESWGKPPNKSRLMHSAGIKAMGVLMDQIMLRADSSTNPKEEIHASLMRIEPYCRWTEGVWEDLNWRWNEIQSTNQHISRLSELLIRLDRELSRPSR
jgi:DGQHR domain-containing protein